MLMLSERGFAGAASSDISNYLVKMSHIWYNISIFLWCIVATTTTKKNDDSKANSATNEGS